MAQSAVVDFQGSEYDYAFPAVDPGVKPFGSRVLVQLRRSKKKTKGGIILTDDSMETEKWNTQTAKVIATGPLAFKNRETLQPWAEGSWCEAGHFVRVPKYGGDRWEVAIAANEEPALFVLYNDLDLLGEVTGDPLAVKAFV